MTVVQCPWTLRNDKAQTHVEPTAVGQGIQNHENQTFI